MCHVLDHIKDVKKIYFPTQKYVCYSYILGKIYQYSFSKNSTCSSKPLGLIHLDLLKLFTLSYLKYKWMIIFLNNYFSYCNIIFLYKKSKVAEVIKSIFWIWSSTTSYSVKMLYTNNRREYVMSELQSFLRKQGIVYKTSTLHVY